jgi:hypothetical protein
MESVNIDKYKKECKELHSLEKQLRYISLITSTIFILINMAVFIKKYKFLEKDNSTLDKALEIIAFLTCTLVIILDLVNLAYISKKRHELKNELKDKIESNNNNDNKELTQIFDSIKAENRLEKAATYFSIAASVIFFTGEIFAVTQLFKDFGWDKLHGKLPININSILSTSAFTLILTSSILLLCSATNNKQEKDKKSKLPIILASATVILSSFGLIARILEGLEATGKITLGTNSSIISIGYMLAAVASLGNLCICIYKTYKEEKVPGTLSSVTCDQQNQSTMLY